MGMEKRTVRETEKEGRSPEGRVPSSWKRRRAWWIVGGGLGAILVLAIVFLMRPEPYADSGKKVLTVEETKEAATSSPPLVREENPSTTEGKEVLTPSGTSMMQQENDVHVSGLRGKVLDSAELPVPRAEVLAFPFTSEEDRVLEARTDEKGSFLLKEAVEGAWYHVQARKKGVGRAEGVYRVVEGEAVTLRLQGGGKIFGHVYREDEIPAMRFTMRFVRSGKGASVEDEYESAAEFVGRSREPERFKVEGPYRFERGDGYFEVQGIPPGRYQLLVSIQEGPAFRCERDRDGKWIRVQRDRDTGPLEIEAPESKQVTARVLDDTTNLPVAGAQVRLVYRGGHGGFLTAAAWKAGEDGRVKLPAMEDGVTKFVATAKGYCPLWFESWLLFADPPAGGEREIRLTQGVGLRVFVADEQGVPEKGARILLGTVGPFTGSGPFHGVTNGKGECLLEGLPAGAQVDLFCLHPSGLVAGRDLVLPESGVGEVRLGGSALVQGPQIRGMVRVDGRPLEAGFVALRSGSGGGTRVVPVTGGAFYSGVLEPGTYRLILRIGTFVRDNDHEYRLDGIVVGGEPVKLALDLPSGFIRGRVIRVGAAATEPVPGVLVRARREPLRGRLPNGVKYSIQGRAKTDSLGRFEIPVLPDGHYLIDFQAEGEDKTEKVDIQAGQGGDLGDVML